MKINIISYNKYYVLNINICLKCFDVKTKVNKFIVEKHTF